MADIDYGFAILKGQDHQPPSPTKIPPAIEERIRQIVREELVRRRDEDGKEAAQLVYDMYFRKPEDEIKDERNHDFFKAMAHRLHDRKAPPPE